MSTGRWKYFLVGGMSKFLASGGTPPIPLSLPVGKTLLPEKGVNFFNLPQKERNTQKGGGGGFPQRRWGSNPGGNYSPLSRESMVGTWDAIVFREIRDLIPFHVFLILFQLLSKYLS